jgi:hypothetical protein
MINTTITAITASASASTSVVEDTTATPLAGTKRVSSSLDLPFLSPSPSKKYPNHSVTKSSGDSGASCNNSGQWEAEGECIFHAHTCKNEEEAATATDGMNDIGKIDEFMFCGIDLNDATPPPIMEEREVYKNMVISFKKTTTKKLVEVAKEMEIQYTGAKKVLWDRIVKSGNPLIVSVVNNGLLFKFCHKKAPK